VDILLTHGPPLGNLDTVRPPFNLSNTGPLGDHKGCPHLAAAVKRAKPRLHCFGHIHEARGALRVAWFGQDSGKALRTPEEKQRERGGGDGDGDGDEEGEGEVEDAHGVKASRIDVSAASGRPLQFGKETVFVHAAIRDGNDRVANRPWVVVLDLPVVDGAEKVRPV